jgi:hypothetical protein
VCVTCSTAQTVPTFSKRLAVCNVLMPRGNQSIFILYWHVKKFVFWNCIFITDLGSYFSLLLKVFCNSQDVFPFVLYVTYP